MNIIDKMLKNINLDKSDNSQKNILTDEKSTGKNQEQDEIMESGECTIDYSKIQDSFLRYRKMIEDAVKLYDKAMNIADMSNAGQSVSIHRMSEPFRKGYFTLAVVGKMSAGKSTFINALLERRDLLPTGYFQTTCTITTITHGEKEKLHVCWGDGNLQTIEENVGETLVKLVAIEKEYENLPVNNINRLILSGKTTEEICSSNTIDELQKIASCNIDEDLLRKYVNEHPKEKIPNDVSIECPLGENYRGWRIVDTPGVDAVGGIEDDTKAFLCGEDIYGNHNVDAIIFIQPAKGDLEGKALNDFVNETIGGLTIEAKKRAFFVLTHASDRNFVCRKDDILKKAKALFLEYAKVGGENRLLVVDSLAELLEKDLLLDLSLLATINDVPEHWREDAWKGGKILLSDIMMTFVLKGIAPDNVTNEEYRDALREISNFDMLKKTLNEFVETEKRMSFSEIINMIMEDITFCIDSKNKDLHIHEVYLGQSVEEFKSEIEIEKRKLDEFQLEINKKLETFRLDFGKKKINERFNKALGVVTIDTFKSLTIMEMRKKADSLSQNASSEFKTVQNEIIEVVKNNLKLSKQQGDEEFILPTIDVKKVVDNVKSDAIKKSEKERYVNKTRKNTSWYGGLARTIGGWFGTDWGWEIYKEKETYTDYDELAKSFCEGILNALGKYRDNIIKIIEDIFKKVDEEIKNAITRRKEEYNTMLEKEVTVNEIENLRNLVGDLEKDKEKLSVYNKYKFNYKEDCYL